jgi:Domain of unknown function (DUF4160)
MPRISAFYGIVIFMYWDEAHHLRPHFHAHYSGQAASIAFDGEILAGHLPRRALNLIADWAALHQDELEANWARARAERPIESIDPLP